ncbi:hypothetical protein L1049_025903 [Liquidambar formosana]|uniref:Bromo domain-containing protein n=1 Tax=Liquidambar formosana TaxID=63359 RepID=A0AAP0NC54_LIQFO
MGKVAETKRKKKKGRPSLLDLQKRTLKQQQLQNNLITNPNFENPKSRSINSSPNPSRPSTRRNPNLDGVTPANGWTDGAGDDEDDDDDERKEKKLKLLFGLPSPNPNHHHHPRSSANCLSLNSVPYGSDLNAEDPDACNKKPRINAVGDGSGRSTGEKGEKVSKATDTLQGLLVESGPTTPLPDKKLLVFILDRLQKKDTYGVYSEPVDPREIPDYRDIIAHPMDFATVRKKLDEGLYSYLEQFESDVFLICSNAMQYNAPDTIYFRQARSIQELAKKDFENLRQDSDDSEPQPKVVRRGRPPSKNLTKSFGRAPFERIGPEFSSDATLATAGDNAFSSNSYNLRKGTTSFKCRRDDELTRASHRSHNNETYTDWSSEWNNEFPVSILKGVSMKYGKKQVSLDENRRETYRHFLASGGEASVLTTLDGEKKQLMAVGQLLEDGYANSVARFTADLGPVVRKIARKKIVSVLPIGLKFDPGWVGETEMSQQQPFSLSEKQKSLNNSVSDEHPSRPLPQFTCWSNSIGASRSYPRKEEMMEDAMQMGIARLVAPTRKLSLEEAFVPSQMLGMVSSGETASIRQMPACHYDSKDPMLSESGIHSGNALALGFSLESHSAPEVGTCGKQSWQGFSLHHNQEFLSVPPDLNVRFQSPGSPTSTLQNGTPQQPDLALQL